MDNRSGQPLCSCDQYVSKENKGSDQPPCKAWQHGFSIPVVGVPDYQVILRSVGPPYCRREGGIFISRAQQAHKRAASTSADCAGVGTLPLIST